MVIQFVIGVKICWAGLNYDFFRISYSIYHQVAFQEWCFDLFYFAEKFFHQGDMRMTQTQKEELEKAYKNGEQRDVISFSSAKWQHYTVPYVIDASIG